MAVPQRVAFITGAASGVGAATALHLARAGCAVALVYHTRAASAEAVAISIRNIGGSAITLCADVTDDAAVRAAVAATIAAFSRLDVVINAAGATRLVPFADLDSADDGLWRSLMDVNVVGAYHVCRAAVTAMRESGGGAMINVSSVAARLVQGSCLPYACSKAALDALTVGLARTFAPYNIRVCGVAPGFIAGTWLQELLGDGYEDAKASYEASVPLRRVCTADDVAETIAALALGRAPITGQTLLVDGGMAISGFALVAGAGGSDDKSKPRLN